MASSESLDLSDAILGNSECLVKWFLDRGSAEPNGIENKSRQGAVDPNDRPKLSLLSEVTSSPVSPSSSGKTVSEYDIDPMERLLAEDANYQCTYLHVAIVNCFHQGRMDGIAQGQRRAALAILDALLERDANIHATCLSILFCNVGDIPISSPGAPLDAIGLTLSLKKAVWSSSSLKNNVHADECIDMMDQVMERLIRHDKKSASRRCGEEKTTTIPQWIVNMYQQLVVDSSHADLIVHCLGDGVKLLAHRCILCCASPVMATSIHAAILEKARNNHNNTEERVVWNVPRTKGVVMGAVLKFIYTGNMDANVLEQETASLLSMATEFQLDALERLCAKTCGERLTLKNVRIMLDIATKHEAYWIKMECFHFLQRHSVQSVLGNPKILSLSTEQPKLWQEILMIMGGEDIDETIARATAAATEAGALPAPAPALSKIPGNATIRTGGGGSRTAGGGKTLSSISKPHTN